MLRYQKYAGIGMVVFRVLKIFNGAVVSIKVSETSCTVLMILKKAKKRVTKPLLGLIEILRVPLFCWRRLI